MQPKKKKKNCGPSLGISVPNTPLFTHHVPSSQPSPNSHFLCLPWGDGALTAEASRSSLRSIPSHPCPTPYQTGRVNTQPCLNPTIHQIPSLGQVAEHSKRETYCFLVSLNYHPQAPRGPWRLSYQPTCFLIHHSSQLIYFSFR